MKKVKSSKDLKEKMLFLLCLGALAGTLNTKVYSADYNKKYKVEDTSLDESTVEIPENKEINISDDGSAGTEMIKDNGAILVTNVGKNDFNGEHVSIKVDFNNKVNITNTSMGKNGVFVDGRTGGNHRNITAKFNSDLTITNTGGGEVYALYSKSSGSSAGATASIIIGDSKNQNINQIVQIIGNLKTESYANGNISDEKENKAEIELNLNNKDSFFAGYMETVRGILKDKESGSEIRLNLSNKGTWYAYEDEYIINGEIKVTSEDERKYALKTIITSDGGVIDIYHDSPNNPSETTYTEKEIATFIEFVKEALKDPSISKETEGKTEEEIKAWANEIYKDILTDQLEGSRKFTLNGVGHNLKDTTFRISTDVENEKSDLIILNDVDITTDSETYHIEIAADYLENGKWEIDPNGKKIYVMDINGNGLDKITVVGEEYETLLGAGLKTQIIKPEIAEDGDGTGDWYLTAVDKTEEKGDGHIFAELGTAVNAGMAAAWRADNSDLYQRMGNLRNKEAEQGVWGRIYTGENEVRKGMDLNLEYRAVQVGYDRKEKTDEGKLFTGIAFGYFDGETDYNHGSGEADSATVGLYATYMGDNGTYGDFIIKYGNLDNELSYRADDGNYYKADYDTYGISADAEYGYRHELDNNYYIEPLAQLSYIYIADEEYTMELNGKEGARVSNDDYQSLIGYAGFHYGKQFENNNVAYLRVAVAHEFMGDIDVSARYQDIHVKSDINGDDTWVEYGVGFDAMVKEDTAVYGRLQRSTGDVVRTKWHASLGIRYIF